MLPTMVAKPNGHLTASASFGKRMSISPHLTKFDDDTIV